jgi:hypothetical protein
VTVTERRLEHPPDQRPHGIKQHQDSQPGHRPGSRGPPGYVFVICANDCLPAAAVNLCDALQAGQDRHRDREPDPAAAP